MSFLPQSRPFSYWSFVKLEIHSKFQMEHIKKCLDTMAMSTLGAPLNTTVERDKCICMQWILYKRIFKNLQKVAGARCLPCTSSCSTMQARRSRLQTAWAELPSCTRDSDPYGTAQPWLQAQVPVTPFTTCWDLARRRKDDAERRHTNDTSSWVVSFSWNLWIRTIFLSSTILCFYAFFFKCKDS